MRYVVLVRAIRNLTASVSVDADSRGEAYAKALEVAEGPSFQWDESDPEDIQTEGVESVGTVSRT